MAWAIGVMYSEIAKLKLHKSDVYFQYFVPI